VWTLQKEGILRVGGLDVYCQFNEHLLSTANNKMELAVGETLESGKKLALYARNSCCVERLQDSVGEERGERRERLGCERDSCWLLCCVLTGEV